MSVVPLAQEWMAAATGLEEGNCWEAVRNASRRKAELSRLMIGRAGKGSEGGSRSGGAQESGAGGVAGREEETNEGLGRAIAEGDRAEGFGRDGDAKSQKGWGWCALEGHGWKNQWD